MGTPEGRFGEEKESEYGTEIGRFQSGRKHFEKPRKIVYGGPNSLPEGTSEWEETDPDHTRDLGTVQTFPGTRGPSTPQLWTTPTNRRPTGYSDGPLPGFVVWTLTTVAEGVQTTLGSGYLTTPLTHDESTPVRTVHVSNGVLTPRLTV